MEKNIRDILDELYESYPSLRAEESSLVSMIEVFLKTNISIQPREQFKKELKQKLLQWLALQPRKNSSHFFQNIKFFAWFLATSLAAYGMFTFYHLQIRPVSSIPQTWEVQTSQVSPVSNQQTWLTSSSSSVGQNVSIQNTASSQTDTQIKNENISWNSLLRNTSKTWENSSSQIVGADTSSQKTEENSPHIVAPKVTDIKSQNNSLKFSSPSSQLQLPRFTPINQLRDWSTSSPSGDNNGGVSNSDSGTNFLYSPTLSQPLNDTAPLDTSWANEWVSSSESTGGTPYQSDMLSVPTPELMQVSNSESTSLRIISSSDENYKNEKVFSVQQRQNSPSSKYGIIDSWENSYALALTNDAYFPSVTLDIKDIPSSREIVDSFHHILDTLWTSEVKIDFNQDIVNKSISERFDEQLSFDLPYKILWRHVYDESWNELFLKVLYNLSQKEFTFIGPLYDLQIENTSILESIWWENSQDVKRYENWFKKSLVYIKKKVWEKVFFIPGFLYSERGTENDTWENTHHNSSIKIQDSVKDWE